MQGGYLGRYTVPDTPDSLMPMLMPGLQARAIAAGRIAAAAVALNGTVYSWGASPLGRLGPGPEPSPVQGLDGHRISKVCIGEYHAVAISDVGQVFTWGATGDGQLKEYRGISLQYTAAPLRGLPAATVASAVACGHQHTLIVTHTLADHAHSPKTTLKVARGELPARSKTIASSTTQQEHPTVDNDGDKAATDVLDAVADKADAVASFSVDFGPVQAQLSLEECSGGRLRPAWVPHCDQVPEQVHLLDKAWYGQYSRPTLDVVRYSSQ
jgi:hypothetical protein